MNVVSDFVNASGRYVTEGRLLQGTRISLLLSLSNPCLPFLARQYRLQEMEELLMTDRVLSCPS